MLPIILTLLPSQPLLWKHWNHWTSLGKHASTCLGGGGPGAITISSSCNSGVWNSSNLQVPLVVRKVGEERLNRGKRKSQSCKPGWTKYSQLRNRRKETLSVSLMMRSFRNKFKLKWLRKQKQMLLPHKYRYSKLKRLPGLPPGRSIKVNLYIVYPPILHSSRSWRDR